MAVKDVISHSIAVAGQGFLRWGASMPEFGVKTYVSLQLLVQNRRRKWYFPLNFCNGIN